MKSMAIHRRPITRGHQLTVAVYHRAVRQTNPRCWLRLINPFEIEADRIVSRGKCQDRNFCLQGARARSSKCRLIRPYVGKKKKRKANGQSKSSRWREQPAGYVFPQVYGCSIELRVPIANLFAVLLSIARSREEKVSSLPSSWFIVLWSGEI